MIRLRAIFAAIACSTALLCLATTCVLGQSSAVLAGRLYQDHRVEKGSAEHVATHTIKDRNLRGVFSWRLPSRPDHSLYFTYAKNAPKVPFSIGPLLQANGSGLFPSIIHAEGKVDSHMYGLGYGIQTKPWLSRFTAEIIGLINVEHLVDRGFDRSVDWYYRETLSGYSSTGVVKRRTLVQPVPELMGEVEIRLFGGLSIGAAASIRYGYHTSSRAVGTYTYLPTGFTEEFETVSLASAYQWGLLLRYDWQWRSVYRDR